MMTAIGAKNTKTGAVIMNAARENLMESDNRLTCSAKIKHDEKFLQQVK